MLLEPRHLRVVMELRLTNDEAACDVRLVVQDVAYGPARISKRNDLTNLVVQPTVMAALASAPGRWARVEAELLHEPADQVTLALRIDDESFEPQPVSSQELRELLTFLDQLVELVATHSVAAVEA